MKRGKGIFAVGTPFEPRRFPVHYGWVLSIAGLVGMIASLPGQTMGINVFSGKLVEALGLTRTQVSFAYFVGTAASGFALPWAGRLFDRIGARRLMVGSCAAMGLSLVYMSGVDRVAAALSGSDGAGFAVRVACLVAGFFALRFFGQGLIMLCSRSMLAKWWVGRRGRVFSVVGIAVSVCFSLAPSGFNSLIEAAGWRAAWLWTALAVGVGVGGLAWLVFRDNPQECGLEPDAGLGPGRDRGDDPEFRIVREFTRGEALRSYAFWAFSLAFALHAGYFTAVIFHIVEVAAEMGVEKAAALGWFFPAALLSGGTALAVGWLSDRTRLKFLVMGFSGFATLSAGTFALFADSGLPVGLLLGVGLSSGFFMTLSSVFMPRFFGLAHVGAIGGVFAALVVIGSAMGPLFFSLVQDWTGDYGAAHASAAVGFATLALVALRADNPQRKLAAERDVA